MGSHLMNSTEIQEYIKNRYPYLMIDRITNVIPGEMAEGYKNLSHNDWFFRCHYEEHMNMPGMLQLEALVEVFIISFMTLPGYKGLHTRDVRLDNVRFRKEILPGDRLEIVAYVKNFKRGIVTGSATGSVNGEIACEADMVIAIPDILNGLIPR